jgi:hypothetical protein
LSSTVRDLHKDCQEVLWNRLGVNPNTHGNYLTIAENINKHGYDAFGLMISQDQALTYHNSMEIQNIIRSMIQQYHDFPLNVVHEFNLLPRQQLIRPRPHTSVDSIQIVCDTSDYDSQRYQASQLLNQQLRITNMHAYQANAIASKQSFGIFHVNEGTPVPWPAPAPPLTATYNNTSPPQTPRWSTTYEEPFTPSHNLES